MVSARGAGFVKALALVLAVAGLGFAQRLEHLPWLVRSIPAYVGSDGYLYAISEVGCAKFLPCSRWIVYRFDSRGAYVEYVDLAAVSMERPTLVRVDANGRIYAAGLQKDGAVWIFEEDVYRNVYGAGQPLGTPVELAFDRSGNLLFLVQSANDRAALLVHIERDTRMELARVAFPNLSAAAMATGPDGSVYIAGRQDEVPVVIRLSEGKYRTFALDPDLTPRAIAVSREGVYVAGSRTKANTLVEGFVARLDRDVTVVEKRASVGGEASDSIHWLGVDDRGRVLAAGITNSYRLPATGAFRVPCGPDRGTGRNSGFFLARFDGDLETLQAYTPVHGISPTSAPAFSPLGDVYWETTEPVRWRPDLNPETAVTCVVRADYSPAGAGSERELLTIFGQGFTDRAQDFSDRDELPLEVDGLTVQWGAIGYDAKPAAILFISPTQINVVLPRVEALGHLSLGVFREGAVVHLQMLVAPSPTPAALVRVGSGGELSPAEGPDLAATAVLADVLNEDGSPNSREHPARPGELVTVFVSGIYGLPSEVSERGKGPVTPARPWSRVVIETADRVIQPEDVSTIRGRTTGVLQVRFRVPQDFRGAELGFGFDRPPEGVRARPYFLYVAESSQ